MKFRSVLAAVAAVTLAVMLVPATAGAQDTTDVFVVHGLNLDGQSAQADGGTNVTVCAGDAALIEDFEFGQIIGPVELPSGGAVPVVVYGGASVDCAAPGGATALITQEVTPSGAARCGRRDLRRRHPGPHTVRAERRVLRCRQRPPHRRPRLRRHP